MSHFGLLVATLTSDKEELEKILQPYHEYECTGIEDEYVVFVDEHDDVETDYFNDTCTRVRAPNGHILDVFDDELYREPTEQELKDNYPMIGTGFGNGIQYNSKDWGDGKGYRAKVREIPEGYEEIEVPVSEIYDSIEKYAKEYCGYSEIRDGRIGRLTNPNAKWDWWTTGGRWSGFLLLKNGERANSALKADIDFEKKIQEGEEAAKIRYDRVHKIINNRAFDTWEHTRKNLFPDRIDEARDYYNSQSVVKDFRIEIEDIFYDSPDNYIIERDEYIRQGGLREVATFAVLTEEGWIEKGKMGFWAMVSDENENWANDFGAILDKIPDDRYLTIVDCHI